MSIGDRLKIWFPQTSSVIGVFYFIPVSWGLFFATLAIPETGWSFIDSTQTKHILYWISMVSFVVFLLPILEISSKIELFPIKNGLTWILKQLIYTVNLIESAFVSVVAFIIRPAVKKIILEREKGQANSFIFETQKYEARDDDHYYPEFFNLQMQDVIFEIQPNDISSLIESRWRFGFKFSKTPSFVEARHAVNYPLFHLTKDESTRSIKMDIYRPDGRPMESDPFVAEYSGNKIIVTLSRKDDVTVTLKCGETIKHYYLDKDFLYFQAFAWADGRTKYQINSEISYITRS